MGHFASTTEPLPSYYTGKNDIFSSRSFSYSSYNFHVPNLSLKRDLKLDTPRNVVHTLHELIGGSVFGFLCQSHLSSPRRPHTLPVSSYRGLAQGACLFGLPRRHKAWHVFKLFKKPIHVTYFIYNSIHTKKYPVLFLFFVSYFSPKVNYTHSILFVP